MHTMKLDSSWGTSPPREAQTRRRALSLSHTKTAPLPWEVTGDKSPRAGAALFKVLGKVPTLLGVSVFSSVKWLWT